jgi:cell wall-associated NlpC family hydrolase
MNPIIMEARRYIGTPFGHMGRSPGHSLDCAGVVVCVAQNLGLTGNYVDLDYYPRDPANGLINELLNNHMDKIAVAKAKPGDVILIAWGKYPQHLAILTDKNTLIHADENADAVVETQFSPYLKRCIRGVYRYRNNT